MSENIQNHNRKRRGRCIIKDCINYSSRTTTKPVLYYPVPTTSLTHSKNERRQVWIDAIIRHNKFDTNWEPTKHSVICNAHFVGSKKSDHPMHPAYNPTLFSSQKSGEEEQAKKMKQQIVEDWSENEEPSSVRLSTVHRPNKQTRKKKKICDTQPTVVLLRTNFVQNEVKCKVVNAFSNDFECQVEFDECELTSPVNCLICNLKIENEMNCAETQINLKKVECMNSEPKHVWNRVETSSTDFLWSQKVEFNGISSIHFNSHLSEICGVNFKQFNILLSKVPDYIRNCSVSNANRLLITLVKFRQGLSYSAIGIYFTLESSMIRKIFNETLHILKEFAENRIAWLKRGTIEKYLPTAFKSEYSNCRAIVDCIELQMELPECTEAQIKYYRTYKTCNTFKVFIACAPNGFIMYKSNCYGGQKADGLIAQDCGFLDLIKSDDVILTDREFPNLEVALNNKGATLKKIDVDDDFDLLPVYMHIKECLNRLKHFKVLSLIPMDQLEHIDSIVQICCSFINLSHEDNCIRHEIAPLYYKNC